MHFETVRIAEAPERIAKAARWFSEKWGVPAEEYERSMRESLSARVAPQWYLVLSDGEIAGGAGVIENDFHERKDLSPNVCALYVEKDVRGRGIARALLGSIAADMKARGVKTLYLVTDHDRFYERCGWRFLCEARSECPPPETVRVYALSL